MEAVCHSLIRNTEARHTADKHIQNWGARHMQMRVTAEGDTLTAGGDDGTLIHPTQPVVSSSICKSFLRLKEGGTKADKCNARTIIVHRYRCLVDHSPSQHSIGSVEPKSLVDELRDTLADGESFYNPPPGLARHRKLKNGPLDCCESLFFCL